MTALVDVGKLESFTVRQEGVLLGADLVFESASSARTLSYDGNLLERFSVIGRHGDHVVNRCLRRTVDQLIKFYVLFSLWS